LLFVFLDIAIEVGVAGSETQGTCIFGDARMAHTTIAI